MHHVEQYVLWHAYALHQGAVNALHGGIALGSGGGLGQIGVDEGHGAMCFGIEWRWKVRPESTQELPAEAANLPTGPWPEKR